MLILSQEFKEILAQCLDSIEARARWVERDRDEMLDWLKENEFYRCPSKGVRYAVTKRLKSLNCFRPS